MVGAGDGRREEAKAAEREKEQEGLMKIILSDAAEAEKYAEAAVKEAGATTETEK